MDNYTARKMAEADWDEFNLSTGTLSDYIDLFPTLDPSGYPLLDPSDDPYLDAQARFIETERQEFIAERINFYLTKDLI